MPYIATISVEQSNREGIEALRNRRELSKITNKLWKEYFQSVNPSTIKKVDIRTETDIDQYITEIRKHKLFTVYEVKLIKEQLMKELSVSPFVIDLQTGAHTSIFNKSD